MRILDRFRNRTAAPLVIHHYVENVTSTVMGMSPSDLYDTQDALRAVVDFISRSIASTSLKTFSRSENDDRERDLTSTTARLLRRPNDHMTTYDLIDASIHELKLHNFVLWLTVQDADAPSGWVIEPIRRQWILDSKTDGFKITQYYIQNPIADREPQWVDASNFICFAYYQAGYTGLSMGYKTPVDPLKEILREQISAWEFRNQVWDRGGRMTAYLSRPIMDSDSNWTPEQRDRFVKAWKERYAGNKAPDAGSMPLLEDGMKIESVPFNARETEWTEATKLSREAVAGVYHVNPAMIWSGDGQTYASVKENARSLYVDCLGPDFVFFAQRINQFLVPLVGDDPDRTYVEFDVHSKLNGSFEEQASVFSTLGGAPVMTINEIRKRLNLPPSEDPDADKLVKPLNVIYGGQPSPQTPLGDGSDVEKSATSAQVLARFSAESHLRSDLPGDRTEAGIESRIDTKTGLEGPRTLVLKGTPEVDDVLAMSDFLRNYFKRQSKPVLANIDRERDKGRLPKVEKKAAAVAEQMTEMDVEKVLRECFDFDRWNKELREDLINELMRMTAENCKKAIQAMQENPDVYDEEYIRGYVERQAEELANAINNKTFDELLRAIDNPTSFIDPNALKSTPNGVYEFAEEKRASDMGRTVATQIRNWSSIAAVHMAGKQSVTTKTWRNTGLNVREVHVAMNGETIPYENPLHGMPRYNKDGSVSKLPHGEHARFSNGLRWPGDYSWDAHQVANCKCEMDVEIGF